MLLFVSLLAYIQQALFKLLGIFCVRILYRTIFIIIYFVQILFYLKAVVNVSFKYSFSRTKYSILVYSFKSILYFFLKSSFVIQVLFLLLHLFFNLFHVYLSCDWIIQRIDIDSEFRLCHFFKIFNISYQFSIKSENNRIFLLFKSVDSTNLFFILFFR